MSSDYCNHPLAHIHYEWDEDEVGEFEEYWCDVCNCYLSPAEVETMREGL